MKMIWMFKLKKIANMQTNIHALRERETIQN